MSDERKHDEDAGSKPARSPRVPVDFSVELEGQTASGEPFRVQAEAVKVSRGGGTFKTEVNVTVGTMLRLTPSFGRSIEAEVNGVWVDESDGKQRIGVKLLDSDGWFAD